MKFKKYKALLHKEERMINRIHFQDFNLNGGDELVDIDDIIVPDNFTMTQPRETKLLKQ